MLLLDEDIFKEPHLRKKEEKEVNKRGRRIFDFAKKVIKNPTVRALG